MTPKPKPNAPIEMTSRHQKESSNGESTNRQPGKEELSASRNHRHPSCRYPTGHMSGLRPCHSPTFRGRRQRTQRDDLVRTDIPSGLAESREHFMSKNNYGERPPCFICGTEGILLTPFGLMCYRDAFAAASEETAQYHDWMPIPVKQPDSAPIENMRGARIG